MGDGVARELMRSRGEACFSPAGNLFLVVPSGTKEISGLVLTLCTPSPVATPVLECMDAGQKSAQWELLCNTSSK